MRATGVTIENKVLSTTDTQLVRVSTKGQTNLTVVRGRGRPRVAERGVSVKTWLRESEYDRLIRVARPHRILDPAAGPLVAVRLHILTRKTLGGIETDLSGRVLRPGGDVFPGLYAAGEVAGFGGGGMHGYRALEGTFLGGCLFSGRVAGRAAAAAVA